MEGNTDKVIVLIITFTAAVATWKMVFDFYKVRYHKIFSHIIAIMTASFMFVSSMILFAPKNYVRGVTPEVEISFMAIASIVGMLAIIYLIFKYMPFKNKQ